MARKGNGSSFFIASSAVMNGPSTAYTYCFWFKPAATFSSVSDSNLLVHSNGFAVGQLNIGCAWNNSGGNPHAAFHQLSSGTYVNATMTSVPAAGVWTHVCVVWDGTNLKMYVNGALNTTTAAATISGAAASCKVGLLTYLPLTVSFSADTIAEVGYWIDTALNANEIAALGSGTPPLQVRPTLLSFYWPLHGVSATETDYSPARQTAAVTGATSENHAPIAKVN